LLNSATLPTATAGPTLVSPAEGAEIKLNKETGRSHNVGFTWDRYAHKNVDECTLQISTDADFNTTIYNTNFTGIDTDRITQVVGPYGATGNIAEFNSGETYYWRVRNGPAAPLMSPWSEVRSFSIESVEAPFDIAAPVKGAPDVDIMPTFTWAPYKGAIGYEIMVAEDSTFAIIDWSRSVSGGDRTFYKSEEALAYNTVYYWRVRGVTGAAAPKKAAPGGPWVVSMFTTEDKPAPPPEPTVIVQKEPAPPAPPPTVIEVPQPAAPAPVNDTLLYVIIVIGGVLVVALIVLIVRTRRVV
jgi:hypothetical protein